MLVSKKIPISIVARAEGATIFVLLAFSSSIYLVHQLTEIPVGLPISIAATLGTAVAILLGFKNNSAYGRWMEARQAWGGLINSSRVFTYQLIAYMAKRDDGSLQEQQDALKDLVKRHLGYVNILRDLLRDQSTGDSIHRWLNESDAQSIRESKNQATMLLKRQSEVLGDLCTAGWIEQFRLFELMSTIAEIAKSQGVSEKIKNTPLMRHYSWFTTAFVWVYLLLLPFCFVELGWKMVPLVVAISAIFVMLDRAGTYTETPFSKNVNSVPLDAICRTIEIDLLQLIGEADLPEPVRPMKGVLM